MAGTHIFSDTPVTTESWSLQGAVVLWGVGDKTFKPADKEATPTGGAVPLIMNQIGVRYGVPVSTFTPLNQSKGGARRILIKGVPEGTLTVQSIFTPDVSSLEGFIKACQKSCRTEKEQVIVSIRPFGLLECKTASDGSTSQLQPGGITFYLRGLDLRQFDFTISQQDQIAMTSMPLTFQFFDLEFVSSNLKR